MDQAGETLLTLQFNSSEPLSPEEAELDRTIQTAFLSDVPVTVPGKPGHWNICSRKLNTYSDKGYAEIVYTGVPAPASA